MQEEHLDLLVAQIYDAAVGRQPWEMPLRTLNEGADGFLAQLMGYDRQGGSIAFSHVAGRASPESHLEYLRHYHRLDPRAPLMLRNKGGGWLHCHEHLSDEEVAADPFYQEFLIPSGGRYASGTKVFEDEQFVVVLAVQRSLERGPLESETLRVLSRVRGHWVHAMAVAQHLRLLRLRSSGGEALLESFAHPMVLVERGRELRHANSAAQAELQSGRYMQRRHGLLGCRRSVDELALGEALNLLFEGPADGRRYLRIAAGEGELPVGVCLSRLEPGEVMGAFGPRPQALLMFHDAARPARPDPFLISEVFELTPAELQVAMLVIEGLDAEAIAQRRGVAMGTVRTQLRGLLMKTGTTRQVDLVRRLLTLERGF
jgi:DNA-binding CsgD family transcriptional regulator